MSFALGDAAFHTPAGSFSHWLNTVTKSTIYRLDIL
jgi:hypothetical protein